MTTGDPQHSSERVPTARSAAKISQWIIGCLVTDQKLKPDSVSDSQSLIALGIDSIQVVAFLAKLEDAFGIRFTENPLDDHPTIGELAQYIANLIEGRTGDPDAESPL